MPGRVFGRPSGPAAEGGAGELVGGGGGGWVDGESAAALEEAEQRRHISIDRWAARRGRTLTGSRRAPAQEGEGTGEHAVEVERTAEERGHHGWGGEARGEERGGG
ncbi:Os06g0646850 [Oryza sativa Japonica Group]|jgi:hypothetical protein|uniref:Os06g0646850 protein n=1 Tax=Oryza sativa subsp. japonica TaxID=39947 RepID=A0A0P0WZG0_ORYSJ|nr:Os06g0646850 [Oryza sativa Japonica Group]